ncbi:hypothetical protein RYX36_005898 [Vicia faba]
MASSSLQQEKGIDGDDTKNIVLKKGKWQPGEDALLREYVRKCGAKKWDKLREKTNVPIDGKNCRFRWLNCVKPSLKKYQFSEEEGRKLIHLYNQLGPKWSQMVSQFLGRTNNELKNFINSRKRSLKNSRNFLVDELNENVGEIIIKRGSSNQNNNASEEKEMTLLRVEFNDQDILFDNYLDQIFNDSNIKFEPLSKLFDDSNIKFEPLRECSYFQDMDDIVPKISSCNMFFDQDLPMLPICSYNLDDQDILHRN